MANKLIGLNGKVVAVIDGNGLCIQCDIDESELVAPGYDRMTDATGTLRCGDAYDAKQASFDKQEKVILEILFRLANDVREIRDVLVTARGGWKTLVVVIGFSVSLGAALAKALPFLAMPRP